MKSLMFNFFFMLRRLTFTFSAVFLINLPFLQIIIQLYTCLMMLIYVGSVKPFNTPSLNTLELFNELCILSVSYHLLVFTDYVPDRRIQYNFGYSIIAITTLNILVNMLIMLYFTLFVVKFLFRKLHRRFTTLRLKLYHESFQQEQVDDDRQSSPFKNTLWCETLENTSNLQGQQLFNEEALVGRSKRKSVVKRRKENIRATVFNYQTNVTQEILIRDEEQEIKETRAENKRRQMLDLRNQQEINFRFDNKIRIIQIRDF